MFQAFEHPVTEEERLSVACPSCDAVAGVACERGCYGSYRRDALAKRQRPIPERPYKGPPLRMLRRRWDLDQQDFGMLLGVRKSIISMAETGHRPMPRHSHVWIEALLAEEVPEQPLEMREFRYACQNGQANAWRWLLRRSTVMINTKRRRDSFGF